MSKPQAIAGKATLRVVTEIPDVEMLQEILNHIATHGDVSVSQDSISYDEADDGVIRPMLAEIGIEVSDAETTSSDAVPPSTATDQQPPAVAADAPQPGATEEGAPAVTASADTPPAATTAPETEGVTAGGETVSEDQLYDGAESAINEAGEVSAVLSASSNDRHWIVIAGGQPIARISLASQPKAAQLAGHFGEQGYWNTVVKAFQTKGIAATLRNLKAEVFTAKAVKASEGPDVPAIVAKALERYRAALSMAFQAQQKNIQPNRLKAHAYAVLEAAAVADPEAVVEAVFAAGDDFLEDLNTGADEYLNMDDSALAASQSMLKRMAAQPAGSVTASVGKSATARDMAMRLTAGNLPITTAGAEGDAAPLADVQPGDGTAAQQAAENGTVAGVDRQMVRASMSRHVTGVSV